MRVGTFFSLLIELQKYSLATTTSNRDREPEVCMQIGTP